MTETTPLPAEDPGLQPPPDPAAPQTINTENERLSDGVNRCPACGSTDIQLRASSAMLVCLFCRHEWAEQQIEALIDGDNIAGLTGTHVASGAADIDAAAAGIMTLKCAGCGAEVVVNLDSSVSGRCHWCRHVLTINEQVSNGAIPDAVLPFSHTHEQAVEAIRQFASKRTFFAHKRFKEEFSPGNVVGVYLPYMVIDSNASADMAGQGEITTRTYTQSNSEGNDSTYYDADVYQVERHIDFTVDDLVLESSAERANMGMFVNTNNIINAIQPFDTKNAVQWNANYLTGFTSEKRDQDMSGIQPVLENQLLTIARAEATASLKAYNRGVRWDTERLQVHGSRWVAMYLPVWLYSFYHEHRGRGMVHYIAVNGRTGQTMGSIPISHGKLWLVAGGVGVVAEILAIIAMVVGG